MNAQKKALQQIKETGSTAGLNARTVGVLERRGNIQETAAGWTLTKRGESRLAGRLGNAANLSRMWNKKDREESQAAAKGRRAGGKIARSRSAKVADRRDYEETLKASSRKHAAAMARVLGPSGMAGGIKISRTDGRAFSEQDVKNFEAGGWEVRLSLIHISEPTRPY